MLPLPCHFMGRASVCTILAYSNPLWAPVDIAGSLRKIPEERKEDSLGYGYAVCSLRALCYSKDPAVVFSKLLNKFRQLFMALDFRSSRENIWAEKIWSPFTPLIQSTAIHTREDAQPILAWDVVMPTVAQTSGLWWKPWPYKVICTLVFHIFSITTRNGKSDVFLLCLGFMDFTKWCLLTFGKPLVPCHVDLWHFSSKLYPIFIGAFSVFAYMLACE